MFDENHRRAFIILVICVAAGWAADIANYFGGIPDQQEGIVHLVCFSLVVAVLFRIVQYHEATQPYRHLIWFTLSAGLILVVKSSVTDAFLPDGPLLQLFRRAANFIWFATPFILLLLYVQSYDRIRGQLEKQVSERTSELTSANHRLQQEICQKMLISNELEIAKGDLEASLAKKTQELKDVEQQVLKRERLLALSQIATGISHELNNTLTPIVTYGTMLLENSILTDEQYDWVERITHSGESAIRVVSNLQQFHRQSSGTELTLVSPTALVRNVVESISPIWFSLRDSPQRTLNLETNINSKKMAYGDTEQLKHVLTNLVMNAIDSMDEGRSGKVTITTRDGVGTLIFEIRDDGRGMDPESTKRCFEPFFTTKHRNSGLGLSACYGIAKRHGGHIEVSSELGKGSTFSLVIPAANKKDHRDTEICAPAKRPPPPISHKQANDATQFYGITILLVEDDKTVRVALTDILTSLGAEVESVSNGPAALDMLRANDKYDIMLTDLLMKEMDGAELLVECREFSDVPLILMSGWPRRRVIERFEGKPKPNAILSKPCKFTEIVQAIEEHAFARQKVE